MKKIFLLLLLLSSLAGAQTTVPYIARRTVTFTAAGSGGVMYLVGTGVAYQKITWSKVGTVTTCGVTVDSSSDGISYSSGGSITSQDCSSNGSSAAVSSNPNYIRITIANTWVGTGSVTVTWTGYAVNPNGVDLASPGPIGGTTPSTVKATVVNATTGYQINGAAPANHVPVGDGTNYVDGIPGVPVLAANSGAGPIVLTCDVTATGNENHILPLTNAGAISVTGCTPGTNLHNGPGIYLDVQGAAAVATYTPGSGTCNGATTCSMGQGLWRLWTGSTETNTYATVQQRTIEHVITFNIGATGAFNKSFEADFSCTIYKATITSDGGTSGTAAIDIWKHASGTIPTSGDKISGTGWTPLSGAALLQDSSSTLSGWTSTTVAKGDLFGGTSTLTTITGFTLQLFCN